MIYDAETSISLDAEDVERFLLMLCPVLQGWSTQEIAKVVALSESLEIDEERALEFVVHHGGEAIRLTIDVFKDDVDTVDLYFFSTPSVTKAIEGVMDTFMNGDDTADSA